MGVVIDLRGFSSESYFLPSFPFFSDCLSSQNIAAGGRVVQS
jgi:hypothetical protein